MSKATPRVILNGISDLSPTPVTSADVFIPLDIPLVFTFASTGPTELQLGNADMINRTYGNISINTDHENPHTNLIMSGVARGATFCVKRLVPEAATKTRFRLSAKLTAYVEDGVNKLLLNFVSGIDDYMPLTQPHRAGAVHTIADTRIYPLIDLECRYAGSANDRMVISLSTVDQVSRDDAARVGLSTYSMTFQKQGKSSLSPIQDLAGNLLEPIVHSFSTGGVVGNLDKSVDLAYLLSGVGYRDVFGDAHVYSEVYAQLLSDIVDGITFGSTTYGGEFVLDSDTIDIINLKDGDGLSLENTLVGSSFIALYGFGGDDGYPKLQSGQIDKVQQIGLYQDLLLEYITNLPNTEEIDYFKYPYNRLVDTGFVNEIKVAFLTIAEIRKDVFAVLTPYVIGEWVGEDIPQPPVDCECTAFIIPNSAPRENPFSPQNPEAT